MPTFCYRLPSGGVVERIYPVARRPPRSIRCKADDGSRVTAYRDIASEHCRIPSGQRGYPFECFALGVLPSQVREAAQQAANAGVPTDFAKNGNPIIRDAVHYKRLRRALGVHQRNSYTD